MVLKISIPIKIIQSQGLWFSTCNFHGDGDGDGDGDENAHQHSVKAVN